MRSVTLQLLWEEYRTRFPEDGYGYSRFCELYRAWTGKLDVSMRQHHRAGEKLFVDYCGQTVTVHEGGVEHQVQIFVAVLGASNYTYAEATWSQQLPDWLGSHTRAFEFFGGVAEVVGPDNLRSAVSKSCRYVLGSRRSCFESLDRPALGQLPVMPFEPAEWSKTRVRTDYHVRLDAHDYSVPYQLVGREVEIRATQSMVEFIHKDRRVALHPRRREVGFTTLRDHMPAEHRHYAEWDPPRLVEWSEKIGPATAGAAREMLARGHHLQGFRRLRARLRQAKLRQSAYLENIDFRKSRGLDKSMILALGSCDWVSRKQNILISGPTGVGKTFLACALAQKACREGHSSYYVRMPRLFQDLALAQADGRYPKQMAQLAKTDAVVLDDFGLVPLADRDRRDLLEILEDRHELRSTVVSSQLPVEQWHEAIGDATLADAILDRLVHNAHRIELKGDSMRRRKAREGAAE